MQIVGVVGLGLLGRGIVTSLVSNGLHVIAYDPDSVARQTCESHVLSALNELIERGGFPASLLTDWRQQLTFCTSVQGLKDCDFVIESITENFDAKQGLYDELETVVPSEIPIASNTSAISISSQQRQRKFPERFIGMHWAEPCHLTSFLEVIRGELTNDSTADQTVSLGKQLGKDPTIVNKDIDGFIVNRLGYAMYREALYLLEQGVADAETIDRAFTNAISVWAPIMGPFRWMDLTGLSAYAAVMERLNPQLSAETDVPAPMKKLMDSGAQGIRNGTGFYSYKPGDEEMWTEKIHENLWRLKQAAGRNS